MDEAYHKKRGGKHVKAHPRCDARKMNISDQRIRGEKEWKERKNWQGQSSAHSEEIKGGMALWGQKRGGERERQKVCVGGFGGVRRASERGADVPFLIPPVGGFVPRPSRKWELGRQQLTKELWRIQLAINGQPQAFVPVAMETAQHHHSKITNLFFLFFSALLVPSTPPPSLSLSLLCVSLSPSFQSGSSPPPPFFFLLPSSLQSFSLQCAQIKHLYGLLSVHKSTTFVAFLWKCSCLHFISGRFMFFW